ncbi:hypothetical protein [Vibrio mangrovi]|uniref:Uncharacterized protein n=2 Tax=Vibrio mangrovi TaxID=474394 RepID=A0A1Y6ITA5_9VIBR|nr:hypothetical protein [Vibrio mangrovi]MDW6004608.1 hypothetical protein [Vibrio mangrovi]SMS00897.1 hypothetical protein VIM7927_02170 [Vibrio mangrovi]
MLTAEGIIGKLVSFIVYKSVDKIDGLPADERKKACRALTKLYYCIQALDEVTTYFENILKEFENTGDPESIIYAINNNSYHAELATNMFVDISYELKDGLELIDPVLAKSCQMLYYTKFNLLKYLSDFVQLKEESGKPYIQVKKPIAFVDSSDLESLYESVRQAMIEQSDDPNLIYSPSLLAKYTHNIDSIRVDFDDAQAITHLLQMVNSYNKNLKESKEHLRVFLRDGFSIEEILFR